MVPLLGGGAVHTHAHTHTHARIHTYPHQALESAVSLASHVSGAATAADVSDALLRCQFPSPL